MANKSLVPLVKALKKANRKQSQLIQGRLKKRIQAMPISLELRRSAYREVLRIAGHTDDYIITTYANAYIK